MQKQLQKSYFSLIIIILIYLTNGDNKNLIKRETSTSDLLSTKDCGTRKNCFISPNDCDKNTNKCNFVLKWTFDGKLINYELTGVTKSWLSVVFSDDKELGKDNVIVCMKRPENAQVIISHYFKETRESELIRIKPSEDALSNESGTYESGILVCRFSRELISGSKYVRDLNNGHYVAIDRGTDEDFIQNRLTGIGNIQFSESAIDFFVLTKPIVETSWLAKVHGSLMIIAWIFLASIGIMIARFYRPLWANKSSGKLRVWFTLHRPIQLTVLALTILGLVAILIDKRFTWSVSGNELTHSIIGIIVISLAFLNPTLALFRPKPDSPMRCVFFWIHWLVGTIAYCLAVPNVFLGMDNSKLDLPNWCSWLLFAWVLFHITIEIILEVHYCCTFTKQDELLTELNTNDNTVIKKRQHPPGYTWKPTVLFIYAAVTAIVVSTIIIAIIIHHF